MCQLLGMNCNTPTDITFSFSGFAQRAGVTDHHSDGGGIAFFEGHQDGTPHAQPDKGLRLYVDNQAASTSPVAQLIRQYPIQSRHVIAHIRKATQGPIALENCHPFVRELWGRYWVFAHNGNLENFQPHLHSHFHPVGDTDSERAFCWLLQELRRRFGSVEPARPELFAALQELTLAIAAYGEFNFLLSNGDRLFAHASTKLAYIVRQAPFAQAHLKDQDVTVDFSEVTTPNDRVAVIATVPLTDNEAWTVMPPGSLWCFEDGWPVETLATRPGPVKPTTCTAA